MTIWRSSASGIRHVFAKGAQLSLCGWLRLADSRAVEADDFACGSCERMAEKPA